MISNYFNLCVLNLCETNLALKVIDDIHYYCYYFRLSRKAITTHYLRPFYFLIFLYDKLFCISLLYWYSINFITNRMRFFRKVLPESKFFYQSDRIKRTKRVKRLALTFYSKKKLCNMCMCVGRRGKKGSGDQIYEKVSVISNVRFEVLRTTKFHHWSHNVLWYILCHPREGGGILVLNFF